MRVRAIIGTAVAGVLVAAGAVLVPLAASAQPEAPAAAKVRTYSFTSVALKQVGYTNSSFGAADADVNAKGKVVGFDTIYGAFNPKTGTQVGNITVNVAGGLIYLTGGGSVNSPSSKGTIAGGTGAFKHAKGSWVAKNLNAAGTKTAVTIKYTL
jgi:hypothetical protein